jgi:phage protein D
VEALTVSTPRLVVVYEHQDITAHVGPSLIDFEYADYMEGESDSVSLALEDVDRRWQAAWYPQFGDTLRVELGYTGAPLLPCGEFEIDEVELSGPPDTVRIKALAAGIKRSVRTRNGRAYENVTLGEVAKTIAKRNKLTLEGTIEPIRIERLTQVYETDLTFLKRVADLYGYSFAVRDRKLCFFKRTELKAAAPTLVIHRRDVTSYRFQDKVRGVVVACTTAYHDPKTKAVKTATVEDQQAPGNAHSADELKLNTRAENEQQARLQADAALDKANEDQTGGSLSLPGQTALTAGVNVRIDGFGAMDGKYTVTRASHRISRSSGYSTDIEVKRVRDPALGAGR